MGCRTFCQQPGRHESGAPTYYPAALLPHNYTNVCGRHDDVNYRLPPETAAAKQARYLRNVERIKAVTNEAGYCSERILTGIGKLSIFLGLLIRRYLPVPSCLPMDPMHLLVLNITDLIISLLCATIACDKNHDDKAGWDWACSRDEAVWVRHGKVVESFVHYMPSSFGHTPRIAEKITSGYKAEEWMLYTWTILPGLLHTLLPLVYFFHLSPCGFAVPSQGLTTSPSTQPSCHLCREV